LEAQCWVPLWKAKKVVLAGDHLQLPPTIKSLNSKSKSEVKSEVKSDGDGEGIIKGMTLETTLFDRLIELYGDSVKVSKLFIRYGGAPYEGDHVLSSMKQ
jgi:DNA polymerase alpha-associated DNA helicase A